MRRPSDATRGRTAPITVGLLAALVVAGCGGDEGPARADPAGDPAASAEPLLQFVGGPWRAVGTEPFWGLEVSDAAIVFTEPAEDPLSFPPADPRAESGTAVVSTDRDGRMLQVTVRDTPCSDGMSDRQYEYSAHVVLDGESLHGCALPDSTPATTP